MRLLAACPLLMLGVTMALTRAPRAAQVAQLLSSPLGRAVETARTVADLQGLAGHVQNLAVVPLEELNNRDWGALEGRAAAEVRLLTVDPSLQTVPRSCASMAGLQSRSCSCGS